MIDCHVHTRRCGHGEGDVADYVDEARRKGLSVITFTEHAPLPDYLDPERCYAMPPDEFREYEREVRSENVDGALRVLFGIEADWLPDATGYAIPGDPDGNRYDMILGAVHFVDGWAFDDPDLIEMYETTDVDRLWERYFAEVALAAESGRFDVMAHPDLVKKFRYMPSFDLADLYDETARRFAAAGVTAEVSTAGLRKPCAELYPAQALLERLRAHGVPITVGSDAHRPAEVGAGWDEAIAALSAAGYSRIVYFERRTMQEVRL